MADNVAITPGSGNTIAADEVTDGTLGSVKVQYVKLMDGTIDGTNKGIITADGLKVDGSGVTQPVSGTFFQATQPVSLASAPTTPVTGTFFQATQPVSLAVAPTTPVTGTFFQATQPVSIAATVTTSPDNVTGIAPIMKTGTLVTTTATADQVVLTYTVTAGKTFYLQYFRADVRLTAVSATASILGTYSLESPAGTKLYTATNTNPTTSETGTNGVAMINLPFSAGTVIRVVCTPAAVTSMTWVANFGGYEK